MCSCYLNEGPDEVIRPFIVLRQVSGDTLVGNDRANLTCCPNLLPKSPTHLVSDVLSPPTAGCLYLRMVMGMGEELRFLWNATRGSRLRPWQSPYLRWRLETYSGQKAETVRARDFWSLFWKEKRQLLRFLRWTREMKGYTNSGWRS